MLEVQLTQQKGHIECGKVAIISQWCYLIAILLEQLKNVEIKI